MAGIIAATSAQAPSVVMAQHIAVVGAHMIPVVVVISVIIAVAETIACVNVQMRWLVAEPTVAAIIGAVVVEALAAIVAVLLQAVSVAHVAEVVVSVAHVAEVVVSVAHVAEEALAVVASVAEDSINPNDN